MLLYMSYYFMMGHPLILLFESCFMIRDHPNHETRARQFDIPKKFFIFNKKSY